jgi:dTMP kinase
VTTGAARFLSFEGIDGAGKSSHIELVAERWRARGQEVVCTREPGGTALAEQLRELVLHRPMDALSEVLLVFAARRDHLRTLIEPALARGAIVLCDRFTDATFAYQGAGRGFDAAQLATLERWVQQNEQGGLIEPDLTLWFDIDPTLAAQRLAGVRVPDRFERLDGAFFERVRAGYARRAAAASHRFARIDAALDRDAVASQVRAALDVRGW